MATFGCQFWSNQNQNFKVTPRHAKIRYRRYRRYLEAINPKRASIKDVRSTRERESRRNPDIYCYLLRTSIVQPGHRGRARTSRDILREGCLKTRFSPSVPLVISFLTLDPLLQVILLFMCLIVGDDLINRRGGTFLKIGTFHCFCFIRRFVFKTCQFMR